MLQRRWSRSGPSRLRLRRRLVAYSMPVALLLLIGLAKIVSTMLAGDAAVADFARHDVDALRADVATLRAWNIVEPGRVSFIAGDLAALQGNLDAADAQFSAALARGADACAVRVNQELVRETQGDLAAARADASRAEQRYNAALQVISAAPPRCFQNNADPDPDRRRVRNDAAARLAAKIKALHERPPPAAQPVTPPAPPNAPPPPPAPAPGVGSPGGGPQGGSGALNDVSPDRIPVSGPAPLPGHRLGPGDGDPLDQLQDTLGDADATGTSGHDAVTGPHS
jgi:hypothetical protein